MSKQVQGCQYTGCDRDGTLERKWIGTDKRYRYCAAHDPLESDEADFFKEVNDE